MSKLDDAELENQHADLSKLVTSDGWKVFHGMWSNLLRECAGALRAKENTNRDYDAGVVSAYERMLGWPEHRIKLIEKELSERSKLKRQ